MRHVVVAVLAVFGCAALLLPVQAAPAAKGVESVVGPRWEHKVVAFGADEKEAAKKLDDLSRDGWEYVGPLGRGRVAFKRAVRSASALELEKFQGKWTLVSREEAGRLVRAADDSTTFTVSGAEWVWKENGVVIQYGAFKLTDPSTNPKQFEFTASDGGVGYSIYQFDGDEFKYCAHGSPAARPTDFTTKAGDGRYCCIWKRSEK